MKVGDKATYILHLTDEVIKERNIPYASFKVTFEAIESGAFEYGNQTETIMSTDIGERDQYFDTRYWVGSFDECCKQIISDRYGRNIKQIELV